MKLSLVISIEETGFDAVAMRGRWVDGIQTAAALGYEGVELAVRDPAQIDSEALRQIVGKAGLEVAAIGTGQAYLKDGLSLTSNDAGIRQRAIERTASHVRLAAAFGAPLILGLIRGRMTGTRQATDAIFAGALERLLAEVGRHQVRLLLEPINRYETDYLVTIDEAMAFIDRIGSPMLGVLADTFHMNIEEASIEEALRRCGPRLGHVHVADSNRRAPGLGHLDFTRILSVLKEVGYRRYLSAEILPFPDPEGAARVARQHLQRLLTAVGTHVQ